MSNVILPKREPNNPLILDSCIWIEYFNSNKKIPKETIQLALNEKINIPVTETIIREVSWKLKDNFSKVEEFLQLVIGTKTQGPNIGFPLIENFFKKPRYYMQIRKEVFDLFRQLSGSELIKFVNDPKTIKSAAQYAKITETEQKQWISIKVDNKYIKPVVVDLHDIFITLTAKPYNAHIVTQDRFFAMLLAQRKIPTGMTDRFYFYNENKDNLYEYIFEKQIFEQIEWLKS